ncbi:MAG TPA: hypothetical protein VKV26_20760 [Dehalococcoidia bacterium]|nr:hypothetical protein [Dehalococcoidia bacterium]
MTSLADEPVRSSWTSPAADAAGRRLRVFARLVRCSGPSSGADAIEYRLHAGGALLFCTASQPTYAGALGRAAELADARAALARLPLRQGCDESSAVTSSLDQITNRGRNAEIPDALQDLAEEIAVDVHEACAAFDDPNLWYPGVDEGIEPVPDEHVRLVIAALQRELDRERRNALGQNVEPRLPPAPLAELPWSIQRALAERRRLRFSQYGIGRPQWEAGAWSLWDVREDADWLPRRAANVGRAGGYAGW